MFIKQVMTIYNSHSIVMWMGIYMITVAEEMNLNFDFFTYEETIQASNCHKQLLEMILENRTIFDIF